jgi:heme oxygenase
MPAARVLMRLNVETRVLHADVDAEWHALLTFNVSRRQYADQLIRVYGFEAPLEGVLAYMPGLDYRDRVRSGLLVEDLLVLGYMPEQIAQLRLCPAILPFRELAEALGWQYAIERATFLHEMLRHHLITRMPELVRACSYLIEGETASRKRWAAFAQLLDRLSETPAIEAQILDGAHAALACQREWYRECPRR